MRKLTKLFNANSPMEAILYLWAMLCFIPIGIWLLLETWKLAGNALLGGE